MTSAPKMTGMGYVIDAHVGLIDRAFTLCEKEEEDGCLPSSCTDKACIQCSLLNDEKSSDVRGED